MAAQYKLLQYFEEQQAAASKSKNDRLFSLLCLSDGFTTKNVKLDSTGLYYLIKRTLDPEVQQDMPSSLPAFLQQDRDEVWGRVLKLGKVAKLKSQQSGFKFAHEIVTDGHGISITFSRHVPVQDPPPQPPATQEINLADYDKVCLLMLCPALHAVDDCAAQHSTAKHGFFQCFNQLAH